VKSETVVAQIISLTSLLSDIVGLIKKIIRFGKCYFLLLMKLLYTRATLIVIGRHSVAAAGEQCSASVRADLIDLSERRTSATRSIPAL